MGELLKRGAVWHADYVDCDGNRIRRSTKMKDKQLAAKVLALWEGGERQVEVGLKQRTKAGDPIETLLKSYADSLGASGKSLQHIDRTSQLIRSAAAHNGWKKLGDVDANGLNRYSQHLLKDQRQAARTVASVITAVRSFCRWCVRNGALAADPTATVQKPSAKTDRRIQRRMILPAEWAWIKKALASSGKKNGQEARERLLMYRLAMETGLRSSELRSLKRSSLQFGSEPHVLVPASVTKNSKDAKQYLSDQIAADLQAFVARKPAGAHVFNVSSRTELARTLRSDIAEARALWSNSAEGQNHQDSDFLKSPNSQGEVIDFHALRHTCGAWLVMQGVTLAEVREIMRHSTITLTVDCYGHIAPDARSRSRQVIGSLLG
jgi:integrase